MEGGPEASDCFGNSYQSGLLRPLGLIPKWLTLSCAECHSCSEFLKEDQAAAWKGGLVSRFPGAKVLLSHLGIRLLSFGETPKTSGRNLQERYSETPKTITSRSKLPKVVLGFAARSSVELILERTTRLSPNDGKRPTLFWMVSAWVHPKDHAGSTQECDEHGLGKGNRPSWMGP